MACYSVKMRPANVACVPGKEIRATYGYLFGSFAKVFTQCPMSEVRQAKQGLTNHARLAVGVLKNG